MATTMMCNAHGPFEGDRCATPNCTGNWRPYIPPEPEPAPTQSCEAPGCGMPTPCPLHPQAADRPEFRVFRAHRAARETPTASPEGTASVRLRFPWGIVAVPPSGVLRIGRDFGDECGDRIAEFDNVSRSHAVIRVTEGAVVVEDQMSTNGTTVNGESTTAYTPTVLCSGDTLGFGAHLRAQVDMTEAP